MLSNTKIRKKVLKVYQQELRKLRRREQVRAMIAREKNLDRYLEKCVQNIIKWNLTFEVRKFIECQFFALNYMPYPPKMMHLASEKALERYEKVKGFYKINIAINRKKRAFKRITKRSFVNKDFVVGLKSLVKWEEREKERFFNKIKGLLYCLQHTTLYNPRSPLCSRCEQRKLCRCYLRRRFPTLYAFRLGRIQRSTFLQRIRKTEELYV